MKTTDLKKWFFFAPLGLTLFSPAVAYAHPGHTGGMIDGIMHPLLGVDHLCAMFGVGFWAAQRGGKRLWVIPLAFIAMMSLGGWMGIMQVQIPFVETGIVASVLIIGILIAATIRLPLGLSCAIVSLFALFHGHAHGTEIPATASGLLYSVGFISSTMFLCACGIGMASIIRRTDTAWLNRYTGLALFMCGIYLCVA